jgi:hypothetical protein
MRFRVNFDGQRILIEEMPGKPVKRRVRRMTFSTWEMRRGQWFHGVSSVFNLENLMRDIRISSGMSYDKAVGHVWDAFYEAVDKAIAQSVENHEKWPKNYSVYTEEDFKRYRVPQTFGWEEEVSWLEIEPKDYKPISFSGKDFSGTAEWDEFTFYDAGDKDDYMAQMEGMRAFYRSKSKGAARKLFKFLKANPDGISGMTVRQFQVWLDKNRIGYRYTPTVWR